METQMPRWSNSKLAELNREQLELVASAAIAEMMTARTVKASRERQDSYLVAFSAGLLLATLACLVGISLH
jgi:hypothetical protein